MIQIVSGQKTQPRTKQYVYSPKLQICSFKTRLGLMKHCMFSLLNYGHLQS